MTFFLRGLVTNHFSFAEEKCLGDKRVLITAVDLMFERQLGIFGGGKYDDNNNNNNNN